ncbi:MAG: VirB4 family type IV secretion/conjugal transfer ATPase, partial [Campylobacteraceae bacterium]|jgi:type IV secretion system protein VirB4|nr:VirB4 family type IV secretion/conjugal transfer ATPase [Campylobacteraceae bacterium]
MEALFKGMTRPAMVMGVPITPFALVAGFIFLMATYINMLLLIALVPAILIMKAMTKKDDFIFRLLGLKFLTHFIPNGQFTSPLSKNYWHGALAFTAQQYRTLKEQGQPKLTAFDLKSQLSFLELVPYSSHFSDNTIIDKDGNFIAVWRVEGVSFEASDESDIELFGENLNTVFKAFASEPIAFYHHNIRHLTSIKMSSNFKNSFLKEIDELYYKNFGGDNLKVNSLYFTMVFTPFLSKIKKSSFKKLNFTEKQNELIAQYKQFKEYCARLENNLQKFQPQRLKIYEENGAKYSEILSFFSYLLSGKFQKVRVNPTQINQYLTAGLNEVIFGKDTIQFNLNDGSKKFARAIEIKDYVNETFAGILDALMYQDVEYVATHSFSLVSAYEAKAAINKQEKQLLASADEGLRQLDELAWAKDALISGDISFGKYHFSVLVFGATIEQVQKNANTIITSLNDMGFGVTLANLALPASYFAQLPCNFHLRPRVNLISSKNFASFVSFHNFPTGKKELNCWGDAITTLKGTNGTPYFLNFHEAKLGRNDFNEKHLGNTLMVGASGAGKTVLQLFLANQMVKYADENSFDEKSGTKDFTLVFFDKDRGAHANVLATGGQYFAIKSGVPTGFNPFMCENSPEKIAFLDNLLRLLVGRALNPVEEDDLNRAIKSVLDMPQELRKYGITRVMEHLSVNNAKDDTLYRRLKIWSVGNAYGWVFDNPFDELVFEKDKNIYGIDGTEFLDDATASAPISLYLFERINELMDGRRFVLNIDECWKWIEDKTVAQVVRDKLKTIRKLNGIVVMATQSPEDFIKNPIARAVVEQSATLIFLPNPKAREEDYVKGFNLTSEQYEMIKRLQPTSRTFLLKKGDETTFLRVDLGGLGSKNLKILSTSKDNWDLIDSLETKGLSGEEFVKEFKEKCV